MGTGKGWTQEETVLACRAYQSASEDPRKGSGKKKDLFTAQVLSKYNDLVRVLRSENLMCTYPDRTGEAIIQRFRKARCECVKFEGIIKSMKSRDPTGSPTDEQFERAALAVYNGEATISQMYTYFRDRTVDAGVDFQFSEALKFLRSTYTWDMVSASKSNRSTTPTSVAHDVDGFQQQLVSSTETVEQPNGEIQSPEISQPPSAIPSQSATPTESKVRPAGTKRALENAKQMLALHKGAEAIEKMAEASRKRTKIAEQMLALDKQKSMVTLFSMPGTDEGMRMEFMRVTQMRALSELHGGVFSSSADQSISDSASARTASAHINNQNVPPTPAPTSAARAAQTNNQENSAHAELLELLDSDQNVTAAQHVDAPAPLSQNSLIANESEQLPSLGESAHAALTANAGNTPHHFDRGSLGESANAALTANAGNTPHHFDRGSQALTLHAGNTPHSVGQGSAPFDSN